MTSEKNITSFWESARGLKLSIVITALLIASVLFWNLSKLGIWEPWEANDIIVAQEYATRGEAPEKQNIADKSWNWAVPTKNKQPVNRSLLKTIVLSKTIGTMTVNEKNMGMIEVRSRAPFAILIFLVSLLGFVAIRKNIGNLGAMITTIAFATMPAIYIGAHNLSSEMMLVGLSSAALLLFYLASQEPKYRYILGILFGIVLALSFLDQRLFGLYLPLLILAFTASVERIVVPDSHFKKFDIAAIFLAILGFGSIFSWIFIHLPEGENSKFLPHTLQWAAVVLPLIIIMLGFIIGRETWVGKTILSLPFLIGSMIVIGTLVVVSMAFGDVNPVLLKDGEVFGKIPVLSFLLEHQIFDKSVIKSHATFDVFMRQVGFSMLPWAALAPLGFAFLAKAEGEKAPLRRLALVWIMTTFAWTIAASSYQHYFFSAYYPIAIGIGGAFASKPFWKSLRKEPLSRFAIGAFAIAVLMMIGKDLERFPTRFIEAYVSMADDVGLAKDFSYGRILKLMKYGWMLLLGSFFFAWLSTFFLTLKELKSPWKFIKSIFTRDQTLIEYLDKKHDFLESGKIGSIVSWIENPQKFSLVLVSAFTLSSFIILGSFIPKLSNNLSQRGVFESYTKLAESDQKIYSYQVSNQENSVYLHDLETLQGASNFLKLYDKSERFFAVIPRMKLAAVNRDIRKKYQKNIPVLDASSSSLLLVSNQLLAGEEDQNFVAKLIVEGEAKPQYPISKKVEGKDTHAIFDGQLEMLGYDLDHPAGKDGLATYKWGEFAIFTYYFKVLKRMPSNQKIFLHVDHPGVRINGDHRPNEGVFTTNYWMQGDIVKVVHPLMIESYSTPGKYSVHFGFFIGSKRATVTPKALQDGQNRVNLGHIHVSSSF